MRSRPFAPFVLAVAALSGAAQAETPPLQGVVSLSSSASIEVTKDLLNVVMTTTREGQDAATVQSQLKQALDAPTGSQARPERRPARTVPPGHHEQRCADALSPPDDRLKGAVARMPDDPNLRKP